MEITIAVSRNDYRKLASHLMTQDPARTKETLKQDISEYLALQVHDHVLKLPDMRLDIKRRDLIFKTLVFLKEATNRELSRYLDLDINRVTGRVTELLREGRIREMEKRRYDQETNRWVRVVEPS